MRRRAILAVAAIWALSLAGCVIGGLIDYASLLRAWLCCFTFWIGVPLAGVTLVLAHDLSGGEWMATAQPALRAAIATMPIASLAGVPIIVDLNRLYIWAHGPQLLANAFYLNPADFRIRCGVYLLLWNALAAYAMFAPRAGGRAIAPGLSWISALGLVALALSAGFAAIDWILSLEPTFWSSAFPYAQSASWFNTGMAAVVLIVASVGRPAAERRAHMADLARILLATTILWAYLEFIQLLIIWEENLSDEIPWYLKRLQSGWPLAIYVDVALGFVIPFFALLSGRAKSNRAVIVVVCGSILLSRVAHVWLMILPEFPTPTPLWLIIAALLASGGAIVGLFGLWWRRTSAAPLVRSSSWMADHG